MHIIKQQQNSTEGLSCRELSPTQLKTATSSLAQKILHTLAEESNYPKALAKELKIHEQKVYYHIRKLESAGLIRKNRTTLKQGALAHYYTLTDPCFAIRFTDFKKIGNFPGGKKCEYLTPFIKNGALDAILVMGSPDNHGKYQAHARDGKAAANLALFLGTYLEYTPVPMFKLDTDVTKKDLQENLIIIGGPIINTLTAKLNSRLPIRFKNREIYSTLSKKTYSYNKTGLIINIPNPFNKKKQILIIAGLGHIGTDSAVAAIYTHLERLCQGNKYNPKIMANVMEGIDLEDDGIIDEITLKE